MNSILKEILTSEWLIHDERKDAYAAILLSLLKGERLSHEDSSEEREKNRSYVIKSKSLAGEEQRYSLRDAAIPEGSIAVIPIRDEIMKYDAPCGPRGTMSIAEDIKLANSNNNIKSIILVVDSPGGQVDYTDILADLIKNSAKQIIGYVEGMAASAAYWIVSGCSKIIASSDLDRIGSIGTMLYFADLQPYYENMGVKFHEIYATKSPDKNKDFNDIQAGKYDNYRKGVLDKINEKFHASVKSARPGINNDALTGKMYFALDAITMGLIDEIGTMEYAIECADQADDQAEQDPENPVNIPIPIDTPLNSDKMKFTEKMSAIVALLFSKPEEKTEELTPEMVEQLNDRIQEQSTKLADLETAFKDERAAKLQQEEDLASEKAAHAEAVRELTTLKAEDAAGETIAGKKKDKIEGEEEGVVYAHDSVADDFLGKPE